MTIVINRMWAYRESDLSEQINDRAAAMGAEAPAPAPKPAAAPKPAPAPKPATKSGS